MVFAFVSETITVSARNDARARRRAQPSHVAWLFDERHLDGCCNARLDRSNETLLAPSSTAMVSYQSTRRTVLPCRTANMASRF